MVRIFFPQAPLWQRSYKHLWSLWQAFWQKCENIYFQLEITRDLAHDTSIWYTWRIHVRRMAYPWRIHMAYTHGVFMAYTWRIQLRAQIAHLDPFFISIQFVSYCIVEEHQHLRIQWCLYRYVVFTVYPLSALSRDHVRITSQTATVLHLTTSSFSSSSGIFFQVM